MFDCVWSGGQPSKAQGFLDRRRPGIGSRVGHSVGVSAAEDPDGEGYGIRSWSMEAGHQP